MLFFGSNGQKHLGFSAWYHLLINRGFGWGSVDNLSLSKPKDDGTLLSSNIWFCSKKQTERTIILCYKPQWPQHVVFKHLQFFRLKMRPLRIGTRTSVTSSKGDFSRFGTSHFFPCPKTPRFLRDVVGPHLPYAMFFVVVIPEISY